jgi:hypothetical protein
MRETWLRVNTRALALAMALPAALALVGLLALVTPWPDRLTAAAMIVGWALIGMAGILVALLVWQMGQARLAYDHGHLLLNLRAGGPIRVPIEVVEGFLLGQGPSYLPGKEAHKLETSTLVIRLAERASEWEQVAVKPALASWCHHYVTIRGTWCQPLSVDLVNRLNARLAEVTRESRAAQVAR